MLIYSKPNEITRQLEFIIQNGSKVIGHYYGIESVFYSGILFDRIKLSKRSIVRVFDKDTRQYLGYIMRDENGKAQKYLADEIDQNTTFKDWFIED